MLADRGSAIHRLVRLKVDDDALMARIAERFRIEQREDDNPEAFKIRLAAYNRQTASILPFYQGQGKLRDVDGMAAIDAVSQSIETCL
jgi:adenylate kinase